MKINCPKCDQEYEVEESLIGQKVECGCGNAFIVGKDVMDRTSISKITFIYLSGTDILFLFWDV